MSTNPQLQSAFAVLPREIRDAIYLQLWRSCGLRQHIVWHDDSSYPHESHLCRWPCTIEYRVEDELQKDIDDLRQQLDVPLGGDIQNTTYGRRLQSPWLNHWQCGEHADNVYDGASKSFFTSAVKCWKKSQPHGHDNPSKAPYMPMLRSCKLISSECLASIYQLTTFIFTDRMAFNMFVGYREMPPAIKAMSKMAIPPPAAPQYTRDLELSLTPNFSALAQCVTPCPSSIRREACHDAFGFHKSQLDQFQNLRSIKIWVAARSITPFFGDIQTFVNITQIGVDSLIKTLSSFSNIDSFTLSMPLAGEIGLEDGYVRDLACPGTKIWKRGAGDRFHPYLSCIDHRSQFDGLIHTSAIRKVQVAHGASRDETVCSRPWI